jgi:putative phosphoesterase
MIRIGLISDTHGLLRPEALARLQGVDHIVHAGDIGDAGIIEQLKTIAPVTAVRGNNDVGPWAKRIPETCTLEVGEMSLYVIHNVAELDVDPRAAGFHAVIYGHSHRPHIETRHAVLFVNPGSAGPRRFRLPVCVGHLVIDGGAITPAVIELDIAAVNRKRRVSGRR